MRLGDVPAAQFIVVPATGVKARVLEHEPSGTLVLAVRRKEIPFNGRLVKVSESHTEIWSNATEVEPVGQLTLDLSVHKGAA